LLEHEGKWPAAKPRAIREQTTTSKVPTMRDVAAAAGVSLSTVSLVVNGKPGVRHDRRERVLKVIKDLNYMTGGRKKSAADTKIIGLLMESLSEASRSEGFYLRIVSGIEETAYELGYQVLLHVYRPAIDPLNSIRELMGRDFWPYGVAANRKVLDTFLHHHHLQGLSSRKVTVDELFHPATFEAFKL
jgi:transcriptional regulator with XRE-family HTH domain